MTPLRIEDIIRDQFRFISVLLIFCTVDYSKSRSIKMQNFRGKTIKSPGKIFFGWREFHPSITVMTNYRMHEILHSGEQLKISLISVIIFCIPLMNKTG